MVFSRFFKVGIQFDADATGVAPVVEDVEDKVGKIPEAAKRASDKLKGMGNTARRSSRQFRGFGGVVQNASYQINDFATQVGAGTSASIALGQQLPQLLQGFGALGAVVSAFVAIGIPLSRVMSDLSSQGRDVTIVFGELRPAMQTIAQVMTTVQATFLSAAETIINNLDRIIITAGVAATIFGGKYVAGIIAARVATMTLAGSLTVLRGALIRTGIGALIVGAGELVYQFTRLVNASGGFGNALTILAGVAGEVWDRIRQGAEVLRIGMQGAAIYIQGVFLQSFAAIASGFTSMINGIANGMNAVLGTQIQGIGEGLANSLRGQGAAMMGEGAAIMGTSGRLLGTLMDAPIEGVTRLRDLFASMKEERLTLPDILGAGQAEGQDLAGGGDGGEGQKKLGDEIDEQLTAQEQRVKQHFDRMKELAAGGLSAKLSSWSGYFQSLVQMTGTNSKRMLAIAKSFGAAQALVDSYQAFTQVLRDGNLPWYAKIPAAASVLAAGLGMVNAIRSVTDGGGGAGAGVAGAGAYGVAVGGGAGPSGPTPIQRTANFNITGDVISRQTGQEIIEAINQAGRDGYRIQASWVA